MKTASVYQVDSGAGAHSNTYPQKPLDRKKQVSIDWLEFTLPADFLLSNHFYSLRTYLNIENATFKDVPRGLIGYPHQKTYGIHDDQVRILYGGSDKMGVHVIVSASCLKRCRGDIPLFINWLLHHQASITRLDLAIDDYSETVTPEKCLTYLENGYAKSLFKSFRDMSGGTISGTTKRSLRLGKTVYLGSPNSRTMVRIYDKGLEQISKHIKQGYSCSPIRPQTRIEIQLRHENAHITATLLDHEKFKNIGVVASSILGKYINFLSSSDQNQRKTRWKIASWWSNFLGTIEKIKISKPKAIFDYDRKLNWFKKQISPSFAALLNAYGPETMREIYDTGNQRLLQTERVPF